MKHTNASIALTAALLAASAAAPAAMNDDPLLVMGKLDQFEWRQADGPDPLAWDGDLWVGHDLNKLWFKTEGERVDGETEEFELQALYSRGIAPYWDFQVGWRGDIKPDPGRNWLAIGFQGLAPYFFEVDTALFVGESGHTAFRFNAEYELLFTQRLILTPEVEFNLYGKDDPAMGIGSGLSDLSAGLRLRYEIRREFAPYVGVNWWKQYGRTADITEAAGEDSSDTQLVLGIRAWF